MKDESLRDFAMIWIKAVATRYTMYAMPAGVLCAALTFFIDWYFVDTVYELRRYVGAFLFVLLIGYVISLWHTGKKHTDQQSEEPNV